MKKQQNSGTLPIFLSFFQDFDNVAIVLRFKTIRTDLELKLRQFFIEIDAVVTSGASVLRKEFKFNYRIVV